MTRLRWLWRAAIAVLLSCAYMGFAVTYLDQTNQKALEAIASALGMSIIRPGWQIGVAVSLVYALPVAIIAVAAYAWLTRLLGPRAVREIPCPKCGYVGHCRNCGYNLTGNVSGVCPECGERI
jgi:hypothetical protein